jgi:hypothetical protein
MAALRCLSKGALSQNLAGLKQSTFIYVLIAAAIVFAAVIISGVVLPRLEPQIEALRERRGGWRSTCTHACTRTPAQGLCDAAASTPHELALSCHDTHTRTHTRTMR